MNGFGEGQHAGRGCCGDSMRRSSHGVDRVEFIKRHTDKKTHPHIEKVSQAARRDLMNELVEFAFEYFRKRMALVENPLFDELGMFLMVAKHYFHDIEFNERAFLEALLGKELVKSYVLYRTGVEDRVVSREADGRVSEPGQQ